MIDQGPARECDVVLAFLQAEVSSSRFSKVVLPIFENNGLSCDQLVRNANLEDAQQNAIRRAILQCYRGFGSNSSLFRGFPMDAQWRFVELEKSDHIRLKFANEPTWVTVTQGSRSVAHLAERIAHGEAPDDPAEYVRSIQSVLAAGASLPPIVVIEGDDGDLILVEGHCRATAYVGLGWDVGIRALLGSSPKMRGWFYF